MRPFFVAVVLIAFTAVQGQDAAPAKGPDDAKAKGKGKGKGGPPRAAVDTLGAGRGT